MVSHEMQADNKKLTAELTGTAQERASIAKTIELERYAIRHSKGVNQSSKSNAVCTQECM